MVPGPPGTFKSRAAWLNWIGFLARAAQCLRSKKIVQPTQKLNQSPLKFQITSQYMNNKR